MCELFVISGRYPAAANFCLAEFARHGGGTGPHRDGWGIAYYEDRAVRMFKEPEPASESDWVAFIEQHRIQGTIILSHIRRATQGARSLKNTQPFERELGGRFHVFAHNGDLEDIAANAGFVLGSHLPVGETDSEHAFCVLLNRLEETWRDSAGVPPWRQRLAIVASFARDIRRLGPANFIYTDGETVFVHGDRRQHAPDESPRPPGLHVLCRHCGPAPNQFCVGGLEINSDARPQEMILVASVPLTEEDWQPLNRGDVLALRGGKIVARERLEDG